MTVLQRPDLPCDVQIIRNKRARRLTLRLDPGGDGAILTLPPFVSAADRDAFLVRHREWLCKALARQPARTVVADGVALKVRGQEVIVRSDPSRRGIFLEDNALIIGKGGKIGPRAAAWVKEQARDALLPAARGYARRVNRRIEKISLRDTRSRWGSCSSSGALSFSWRLAMAPPSVLDYVAAHEAAHLVEMNHSPKYWAIVDQIYPGWQAQRDWLKQHGRSLHRFDFG